MNSLSAESSPSRRLTQRRNGRWWVTHLCFPSVVKQTRRREWMEGFNTADTDRAAFVDLVKESLKWPKWQGNWYRYNITWQSTQMPPGSLWCLLHKFSLLSFYLLSTGIYGVLIFWFSFCLCTVLHQHTMQVSISKQQIFTQPRINVPLRAGQAPS